MKFNPLHAIFFVIIWSSCQGQSDLQIHQDREQAYYEEGSWANYGNTPGGMRHSPLSMITPANIGNLKVAWTFRTGELETYAGTDVASKAAFEATPIMVDGVLYFDTPTNRVFAVDAASGEQKWEYDPDADLNGGYSEVTSRGVSKWIDSGKNPGEPGYMMIICATIDGRLILLDAESGEPAEQFSDNGQLDLRKGIGHIQITSPPAVIGDLIIVGSTMGDNQSIEYPRGVVRAIDARSGEVVWLWDPIPRNQSDPAYDTWQGQKAHSGGAANAWAPLSVDIQRDMVFVPTSAASPDYYGGERKGTNLYANSLVALKASTGEYIWHFQAVHHDLWDFDNPAQPLLADLDRNGARIPAVILVTKMGHVFVMHRETGEHLFPVEERPVPASDLPGEEAHPTQPFPAQLPLLGVRDVNDETAFGPTEADLKKARAVIGKLKYEGIFTPPSLQGTIMAPGNVGGMNWSGASFDPGRQLLVSNINNVLAVITMHSRDDITINAVRSQLPRAEIGRQEGTPYIMTRDYLFDQTTDGELYLQTRPPWGTLLAVDLDEGDLEWETPLGIMLNPSKYPGAETWGSLNLGGAVTTASGLTFVGATVDNFFRAFDTDTGELLWQYQLPAGGQATPMTYSWNGVQYVVICAGGHGKLGSQLGDYVVAFSL